MIRFKPTDPLIAWRTAYPFEDGRHGIFHSAVCHFGTSQKSTTQTTQSAPWGPQQPYLTSGFQDASQLLGQPAPTQANPVAPLNSTENSALSGIIGQASAGTPITGAATNFATNLENGGYLNSNPANGYFSSLAGNNLGLTGPGAGTLSQFAGGGGAGSPTLQNFANGSYFGGNSYGDPTAQSIMAQVIPQVASTFNRGNSINNPAAARSAAEGVTSALAPIEYQNYQTQEQLQQNAANTLGANAITAANAQQSGAISGAGVQNQAAGGLAGTYQDTLAKMVQGNALAPQTQALSYGDLQQQLGAGQIQQQQSQNEASGQAATQNFAQMSPYQQLQAYMQAVGGGYGSTGSTTTPYFQNNTANTLGAITGGASAIAGGASAVSSLLPLLAML